METELDITAETDTHKRIWDKTADEVTVGDELKLFAGITALIVVVPVAAGAVLAGAATLQEKFRARKLRKAEEETAEHPGIIEASVIEEA